MTFEQGAGLNINVVSVVYCRQKIAFPPPEGPPLGAEAVISMIESAQVTAAVLPPSTLNDIGKNPHLLKRLSALKYVLAAGSAVSQAAGDAIIKKTVLVNHFGSTELGALPTLEVDQKDWAYIRPSINAGVEFRHASGDEYEMVVVRDERLKGTQPTFELFPDLQEYPTHDLFSKHPTKHDRWLYQGRSDDVIVFLTGEKTNPIVMEDLVQSHPEVRSALVVGQNRFEAALLIELSQPSKLAKNGRVELIRSLWPVVEEANQKSPAYARVSRSHILFTSPEKPMSRTGKGTVQRRFTIENYSAEIDALYSDAENTNGCDSSVKFDPSRIRESVQQTVAFATGLEDLGFDDDFFSRGMDSLQAVNTAKYLKSGLQDAGMKLANLGPSTIYANPTITKLTSTVESFQQKGRNGAESAEKTRIDDMKGVLEKYSDMPTSNQERPEVRKQAREIVVLTGSTGGLGSYLLEALSQSDTVSKIFCLNRSADSEQRQASSSASRGLTSEWRPQRVVFLTSDFSKEDLGLGQEMFSEIRDHATTIVHNAWQVDFNLSLASYEHDHVNGVRNLIHLAARSTHGAKIFFISSIADVMAWPDHHNGPVPEEIIADFTVAQHMGYAESKHISERLLALASTEFKIPISICRVGQVAGPVHGSRGMWNKQEWLPSLILSSRHLGNIPETLGVMETIDWIPIDLLSSIIFELALKSSSSDLVNVYHTVNPRVTTWTALLPHVQAALGTDFPTVPLADWLAKLKASAEAQDFDANPALKLLDFYDGLLDSTTAPPRLQTAKTERECRLLAEVGPVKGEWMKKWIDQWEL